MYRTKSNQDIVRLLLRLKAYEQEYPPTMFVMRRETFHSLVLRIVMNWLRK